MNDVSAAIRLFENSPGWWDEAAWERVKAENTRLREQFCGGCSFAAETGGNHDDCPTPETMKPDCSYRLREQAEAWQAVNCGQGCHCNEGDGEEYCVGTCIQRARAERAEQ